MKTRWMWLPVAGLCLSGAGCGSDAKGDKAKTSAAARKKADDKADEDDTAAERAERLCEARCARTERCATDEKDEHDEDACMHACRLDENPWMHVYRTRFVMTYADCLDRLPCKLEIGRCEAVAVATVLEPPKDPEAEDDDKKKSKKKDDKAKKDAADGKKKPAAKKKKKKKTDEERAEERKRARQTVAAKQARELFDRCHERRITCDATWEAQCHRAAALTDGGRIRVKACLREPCAQVRACLQNAVSW